MFRPDISEAVDTAYEHSLRFSEHTFGLANQHYVKQPFGKNGADWDRFWAEGLPPSYRLMEESLAGKGRMHRGRSPPGGRSLRRRDPHAGRQRRRARRPHRRVQPAAVDARRRSHAQLFPPARRRLAQTGGRRPGRAGRLRSRRHRGQPHRVRRFVAQDIPPMGYRTFVFSNEQTEPPELAADEKTGVIESPFFKATLDPKRGRIASLVDKRTGRELVDAGAPQGFGQYLYERFGYQQIADWLAKCALRPIHGAQVTCSPPTTCRRTAPTSRPCRRT